MRFLAPIVLASLALNLAVIDHGDPIAVDGSAGKDTSVDLSGAPGRHFLIWITDLNGTPAAEIFGAQLES